MSSSCLQNQFHADSVSAILSKHPDVAGVQIGLVQNYCSSSITCGFARKSTGEAMSHLHYMECASLSKTVAAAFAIEYFSKKDIPLSSSVNELLCRAKSPWRIATSEKFQIQDIEKDNVTLEMLMNHTALGMHYVYGVPLSHSFPSSLEFLNGSCSEYGYAPLYLERKPGVSFKYSGGGFIVLQHLLEMFENGKHIQEIMQPFLDACGMYDFTFDVSTHPDKQYAYGQLNSNKEVQPEDGGRLSFPPLAAGGLCTAQSLAKFVNHLSLAYTRAEGSGGISYTTAQRMLNYSLIDMGSMEFMLAKMGVGVFVATAGNNKIMIHQAANDGFRGMYMMCFDGPNKGNGFVLLVNGDNPAVFMQCEIARYLLGLECLNMQGIDFNKWKSASFNMTGLKQETIVNLGLKELVLSAFISTENNSTGIVKPGKPIIKQSSKL